MLKINKCIVVDEDRKPVAVQIPIKEFERMEEVIENYGLAKLMDEVADDEQLSLQEAQHYYGALKQTKGLVCNRIAHRRDIYRLFP